MSQFAWTFEGGIPKQEVTSITLVNNTLYAVDVTVPTGKRWLLKSIKFVNCDDVDRNMSLLVYKEVAKTNLLFYLMSTTLIAAGLTRVLPSHIPTTISPVLAWLASSGISLAAGNTIRIVWEAGGASTGAVDADGLVLCYLEIDAP